jgi:serine/threonine protein kinase
MHLKIDSEIWARAHQFFLENPTNKKFIPQGDSYYSIHNTEENILYAVPRKNCEYLYTLGEGTFAKGVLAQSETGEIVVAKKIFDPDFIIPDDHSIEAMKHLNLYKAQVTRPKKNPKIVEVEGVKREVRNKRYIFVKRAPGKRLDSYYDKDTDEINLSELQIDMVALKTCLALLEYHEQGVVHGDLNAGNILLDTSGGDVKITLVDQGFSILLSPGEKGRILQKARGTKPFAAPEIYSSHFYSFQSDLYALGVILEYAKRKTWASHLTNSIPESRYSLYEMISLILQKIRRDYGENLPAHFDKVCDFAIEILDEHFNEKLEQGMTLEDFLRGDLHKVFLEESEASLLALYLCKVYYDNLQTNKGARIFGLKNFNIKFSPTETLISFNSDSKTFTPTLYPREFWNNSSYSEKTSVYILGKICELLDVNSGFAANASSCGRPTLLKLMSDLHHSLKDRVPSRHAASVEELKKFLESFDEENSSEESISPSLTQSPDIDAPLVPPYPEAKEGNGNNDSVSSTSASGSEDDLARHINELGLHPQAPVMLTHFRRTTPTPADSSDTLLRSSAEEQQEDSTRCRM